MTEPTVGDQIEDRYVLERILGRGGMGVVFAAWHRELDELVAIKLLHRREAADGEQVERFVREGRLATKIKNEHVVRVLDVARGRDGTPPFMVMEYLEGFDLGRVLQARGPLPPSEAVDYVLQACEAVAEAHALGIVHRDLKPSNLLLTRRPDGTPLLKVLDFGISKTTDRDDDSSLTTSSDVFGSPAYMSPEQIRSAKDVDQRTDVWALGVVLFELIAGKAPFPGTSRSSVLAAIVADAPLDLTALRPSVPPGLKDVILGCLEKDRDKRVASIAEMASHLSPFAGPDGISSLRAIQAVRDPSMPFRSGVLMDKVDAKMDPVGRTDRGVVVQSQRALKSSTPRFFRLGVLVILVIAATWFLQRRPESRGVATGPTVANDPPSASPPVESAKAPVETPAPSIRPTPNETVQTAGSIPPPPRWARPRPRVQAPPASASTFATPASSHPSPRHVDTDSRQ